MSSYAPKRLLDPAADAGSVPEDPHARLDAEIGALNAQAERCRRLAEATFNREVNAMLGTMAEGFERTAGELSKQRSA